MSVIDPTSEARAVGAGAKNQPFSFAGANVVSRIGIAATFDPLILPVEPNVPILILGEADAGSRFGYGFPAHRLAQKVFKGTNGAGEVYVIPMDETGTESAGEIAWSGAITTAGTIYLRIANELYLIGIAKAATVEEVSDAVVALVNSVADVPVIAAKTAVTFETTFTAKAKGAEGDNITITLYAAQGESEKGPTGLVGAITPMTGGAGVPDIQDVLDGLGTEDDANEINLTCLMHGNGVDVPTMDSIQAYVGDPNTFTGLYSKLIGRPFFSLSADTTPGSAGLIALKAISDVRLSDPANGFIGAPDEDENPTEIAALSIGYIGKIGQNNPAENYGDQRLEAMGGRSISANRWTKNYSAGRDTAVKNNISPTKVFATEIYLQNVVTFYRPPSISTASNGFKSVRSFWITRNVLHNIRLLFEGEDWKGITIVADKSKVTDIVAKQKARDLVDVRTAFNNLTDYFVGKTWFYDDKFPKQNSEYAIRGLSNGFDVIYKYIESGEMQIVNVQSTFDKNIAAAS